MKNPVTIAIIGLSVILTLKYPAATAHTVSGWCTSVGVFIGAL